MFQHWKSSNRNHKNFIKHLNSGCQIRFLAGSTCVFFQATVQSFEASPPESGEVQHGDAVPDEVRGSLDHAMVLFNKEMAP